MARFVESQQTKCLQDELLQHQQISARVKDIEVYDNNLRENIETQKTFMLLFSKLYSVLRDPLGSMRCASICPDRIEWSRAVSIAGTVDVFFTI